MRRLAIVLVMGLAACGGPSKPQADSSEDLGPAIDACGRGDFATAEGLLRDRKDFDSIRLRARLLLMRNRNREAIALLLPLAPQRGQRLKTYEEVERQQRVLPDLALAYVREDDFLRASLLYGQMGQAVVARKYQNLSQGVAYLSNLGEEGTSVDFQLTDPLPVVEGTVNGLRALFVLDTMQDEIILDRQFAKRASIHTVGFADAGGYEEGTAQEIGLGRATIRSVPLHAGVPMEIGRLRIDGVIGLQLLLHFDFTIDYRRSRLILRKAGGTIQGEPAYRLGDRYLILPGTLNGKDRIFVAIGSGLKGVTLAASDPLVQSLGGVIRELSAGPIKLVKPLLDMNAFPAGLESSFGIPVGFVLGHSALRNRAVRVEPRSMKILID